MAEISVTIEREDTWLASDTIELLIGSENAASLAASTPAGGRVVMSEPALPDDDASNDDAMGDLVLTYQYTPTDICCNLPVGVRSVDEYGNASTIDETLLKISDPPFGVRNTQVTPVSDGEGGSVPGAFTVSWTQSKHLTPGSSPGS